MVKITITNSHRTPETLNQRLDAFVVADASPVTLDVGTPVRSVQLHAEQHQGSRIVDVWRFDAEIDGKWRQCSAFGDVPSTGTRINRDQAIELRASIRGDGTVGNDEQFLRRVVLRGVRKAATVVCHHCCVAGLYSGYAHVDGTPVTDAVAIQWR